MEYTNDADGNRIMREEVKSDGTRKVENHLKAVSDKEDLLIAMAYGGDGNRIFQLNYNLHTDDDWKGNSGNGNGNNKDNPGSGNSGNTSGNGKGSKTKAGTETATTGEEATENPSFWDKVVSFFTGNKAEEKEKETATASNARKNDKPNGNNGNGNGNKPEKPSKPNKPNDNNGNANGNTNNTGGSQNQSRILFPIDGEVSELEGELIGMIKTTGKEKNYELVEYVNDVNREHTEVLMELNINGIMDTAYSYGDQRLTNERFTDWTGYYTYDPRGSVTGVTDEKGMIWQSYRYDAFGSLTFGQLQYNNVYTYNAESYNPNVDAQYLRARYYSPTTADFISEDSYLGDITDPLTLNRYNYTKSSPLNYRDPSGHDPRDPFDSPDNYLPTGEEIEQMGRDYYERWSHQYNQAKTTDERWSLVDQKRDYLYGDHAELRNNIEKFILLAIDKGLKVKELCGDFKSGYHAGSYEISTKIDNFVLDVISFGHGNSMSAYIEEYDLYIYIKDIEKDVINEGAYDFGFRTGRTLYVLTVLNLLGSLIGGAGTAPSTTGGTYVTPEGFEVYIGSAAGAEAIGIMPVIPGSLGGYEGDSEAEEEGTLPEVKYPGDDPATSPGKSWEWRGPDQPGGEKGAWYNPKTGETLKPDLNHGEPVGPHWDYIPYKNGPQYRVYPDGTIILK